jgi:hypothetical protein
MGHRGFDSLHADQFLFFSTQFRVEAKKDGKYARNKVS